MSIELAVIISIISVASGFYIGMGNLKLNQKKGTKQDENEIKQDAISLTTVIVKLENIGSGIAKIEAKMNTFENDRKEDREKIIRLDESLKSAWKRIEIIESKEKEG